MECPDDVMDSDSEYEIGEPHANSSRVGFISLRANTLEKVINSSLPSAMGYIVGIVFEKNIIILKNF